MDEGTVWVLWAVVFVACGIAGVMGVVCGRAFFGSIKDMERSKELLKQEKSWHL